MMLLLPQLSWLILTGAPRQNPKSVKPEAETFANDVQPVGDSLQTKDVDTGRIGNTM